MSRRTIFLFIFTFLNFINLYYSAAQDLYLHKPQSLQGSNLSGDNQFEILGSSLKNPVRVLVTNSQGIPVSNIPVSFENLAFPEKSKGLFLNKQYAVTDSSGIASVKVKLDNFAGEYTLLVKIKNSASSEFLIYRFGARESNWLFMLLVGVVGGLVLFLLGMNMMSEGMQKSAGDKLRSVLASVTKNRLLAYVVGAFVTMIIQSSSATAVIMISFVNSRLIRFNQTLAVILGAAIGTSLTAQLIAFRFSDYALVFVVLGFCINSFSKNDKLKHSGAAILGFGLLFYGMSIMSDAMSPMRT